MFAQGPIDPNAAPPRSDWEIDREVHGRMVLASGVSGLGAEKLATTIEPSYRYMSLYGGPGRVGK